jgi:thioredoxin-like negative regulator of GroEL
MRLEYFTAPWCAPCKTFGPIIEKVAGEKQVYLDKINIQENPERLPPDVLSVPTVIGYLESGFEFARFVGTMSEEDLSNWLIRGANA